MAQAMLEVLKELEIIGDQEPLDAFVERASRQLPSGWSRNFEGEISQTDWKLGENGGTFWFRCEAVVDRPPADLFLMRTPDRYRVTNVVPQEVGELTRPQYNAIVDDFASRVASPAAGSLGLEVVVSSAQKPITAWMSPAAARLLRRFSALANKSTGSGHPNDFDRWATFLIQLHREQARLDGTTLRRWLIEVEQWPEETALGLVSEFVFARELLNAYDAGHDAT